MAQCRREVEDLKRRVTELELLLRDREDALGAARVSEERLAEAERIARAGNFEWDALTDKVTWSAGLFTLFGIRPEDFTGSYESYLERIHPADRDRVAQAVRTAMESLLPYEHDYRIARPDGTIRMMRARGEVVVDKSGTPVKFRGTCQDVTEEVRAEQERARSAEALATKAMELRQAQELARLKDHFLSTISHEMKTPLSLVVGYAELMQDKYPDCELLAGILDGARRLSDLVSNIVDLAALLGGSLTLYKTEVCLPEVIQQAVATVERASEARKVRVEQVLGPDLPAIRADARRVVQMLVELLENAIKFSPEGGAVRVEALGDAGVAKLRVSDNGPGLEEAALSRIFEAFHQEGIGTAVRKGGLGIGLAIVKLLAELHGGRVAVESDVGRGSRFSVILPVENQV